MKFLALLLIPFTAMAAPSDQSYVVVVSEATHNDPEWKPVVSILTAKHHAQIAVWKSSLDDVAKELSRVKPRYTCFVAKPAEATRSFVQSVHRLTRRYDDDPYTDTFWGILTGYDAANARAIASEEKPLTIHKTGSGTEVALDRCEAGTWYCELRKGHMVQKNAGGSAEEKTVEPDTTKALVDLINTGAPDLWVTSGHATERDWMIGFRYRNGFWKSKAGQLFGEDTKGGRFDVNSPNPKVFLPIGNCLMGHIDGPDAMALAYMKSAAVRQMIGYVLPTWYGYQGWGMLDYFVEQPGRFTMTEAFHANHHALIHRLLTCFPGAEKIESVDPNGNPGKSPLPSPGDAAKAAGLTKNDLRGLLFDRDNVAFYGDPAWEARMAPGKLNWEQKLTVDEKHTHTLTITPLASAETWSTVNKHGSQRGGRPIIQYLPFRIDPAKIKIESGSDLNPVIADDFILVPLPNRSSGPLELKFSVQS
ncbi:MAG TPA: hypothetical protein VG796_14480 [Verrucomicrobiales bacterium]|nr:hypothetical protein [Verrucomicrobiales bacterium]